MFKFLHAADVHLDSPLRGLSRYPGAPVQEIRLATRNALANLVQLALREKVAFVLISGDLYDGDWEDYHTGLHFVSEIAKLHEAGIWTYLISGNHDAQSKMTRDLRMPGSVYRFDTARPESKRIDEFGVTIHGQGFATMAVLEDLAANYPKRDSGHFNIGMLHTSLTGREGHERYAPCNVDTLLSKEYDYWALGHVHLREVVQEAPLIVFPGNIQGRHIREQGPKGCAVVHVDEKRGAKIDWHWVDVLRWEHCSIDVSGEETEDDLFDAIRRSLLALFENRDGRLLAIRVELCGASPFHQKLMDRQDDWLHQIRAIANEVGSGQIWIEKLKVATCTPRTSDTHLEGSLAEILQWIESAKSSDDQMRSLRGSLDDLQKKLRSQIGTDLDGLDLWSDSAIRDLLEEVSSMLTHRLLASGDAA